MDRFIFKS